VTYGRASAIKACLNRTIRKNNQTVQEPQPEFTAMLDSNNPDNAYRMGRLFAALEKTQEDASPGLNAPSATGTMARHPARQPPCSPRCCA
jgi:CRISPR-associated protein Csd1